jgi:hypothetical protein
MIVHIFVPVGTFAIRFSTKGLTGLSLGHAVQQILKSVLGTGLMPTPGVMVAGPRTYHARRCWGPLAKRLSPEALSRSRLQALFLD